MPLEQSQIDEYTNQAKALKKKLQSCAAEIMAIRKVAEAASRDPSKRSLFFAKSIRAKENLDQYIQAWDRLILLYVKLEVSDNFPTKDEDSLRMNVFDSFDHIKAIEINLKAEPNPQPRLEATCSHETFTSSTSSKSFLDKLQLPYFNGDVKCWVRYRDVFSSLIHSDPSLSPVAKLHLLISSLSGEALSVVSKFEISDTSYPLAWKALNDTYDNPRVLATSFLDQILDFRLSPNPRLHDFQQFLSHVADSISAFKALKFENAEDKILALVVLRTLDSHTRHRFEVSHITDDFPTVNSIISYIRNQCQALKLSGHAESSQDDQSQNKRQSQPRRSPQPPQRRSQRYNLKNFAITNSSSPSTSQVKGETNPRPNFPSYRNQPQRTPERSYGHERRPDSQFRSPLKCPFCQQAHILSRCPSFMGLSITERLEFSSKWHGCKNCLNPEHKTKDCNSRWTCRICRERHHTLLHSLSNIPPNSSHVVCGHLGHQENQEYTSVILGTACAATKDPSGRIHTVRLLLDCGSQKSFITNKCADRLHLKIKPSTLQVSGLGGNPVATVTGSTFLQLTSLCGDSRLPMTASVLSNISSPLPRQPVPLEIVRQFKNLQLADPKFNEPREVDILLGADYYDQVVTGIFHKTNPDFPATLPTIFGMVIMGSCKVFNFLSCFSFHCQEDLDLNSQLKAFWELEEPTPASRISPDDSHCEKHFSTTHSRDSNGRYIVRLPFSEESPCLGNNRAIAAKRFFSLETKLARNEEFREDYISFMTEYEELQHMEVASQPSSYVIPHFGIMQNKLRVVFDASCPSNSRSLNDILLPGPKLQAEIADVLTQFRKFPIAITTDLVKMYRQVLLHPDDRKFQHIFWRSHPRSKSMEYQLNTVTYGLAPSAFLAIRCVHQLMQDEGEHFPLAIQRLLRGMYVDDIASGANNAQEARQLCTDLIQFFSLGGFTLSKWSSSQPSVLPEGCETASSPLSLQPESSNEIKVLGLVWNPDEDTFSYSIKGAPALPFTKRTTLSFIAKMFDPLGLLAPVIFKAKIFLQELWRNQLDWDDELPTHLQLKWTSFIADWDDLSQVRIPRYMFSHERICNLVGFCDASILGYSAVVYLQVQSSPENSEAHILKAKTKVAPSNFVSVARLELCGAYLLAKLVSSIDLSPDLQVCQKFLFSDSMVALAWINTPSHLLRVFEANRVAAINELTPDAEWRHVASEMNPADVASRGMLPSQIADSKLWWHGPAFLSNPPHLWNNQPVQPGLMPEDSLVSFSTTLKPEAIDSSWIERFSSFKKLLRTVTVMLRFAHKSQDKKSSITVSELNQATIVCSRVVQRHLLPKGILSPELSSLSPFLDELGVLRVGGRLQHAPLDYSARHPIIIPKSHLAKLIIKDVHESYYHAGPSLTLALVRSRFWIPSSMRFIKSQLKQCIPCLRRRPVPEPAVMAPLPASRLTPGRTFQHTGLDFAGPFTLKDSNRRKPILSKGYICLFVCMATKALHLEAVSSLTSEAFLARFIARRGKPAVIHSDNATNFVGASRYLKDLTQFLASQDSVIASHLSSSAIEWQFIPPRTPHFGGLWEAGVKSVKALLASSLNLQPFTYEELATILSRIESLLNSRPLCPISEDPDSIDALTPGHFLTGSTLCPLPEENVEDIPLNRLSRWQHVQRQVQNVWSRWRLEYLNTLQQRHKWKKDSSNLCIGDLVVLVEKKAPCGLWPLARVIDVHPGSDGTVRVVTIKTSTGSTFKRTVHHLAKLPNPQSSS